MPRAARVTFFCRDPNRILIDDVSLNMFTNICRGLFEKDKMLYAFMIAIGVLRRAGEVGCTRIFYGVPITKLYPFLAISSPTRSHLLLLVWKGRYVNE